MFNVGNYIDLPYDSNSTYYFHESSQPRTSESPVNNTSYLNPNITPTCLTPSALTIFAEHSYSAPAIKQSKKSKQKGKETNNGLKIYVMIAINHGMLHVI